MRSRYLPGVRAITVYLPVGYDDDDAERRHPVLYLHDGQNLFDPEQAYVPGEHWRVAETVDALVARREIEPLVVVGVDHGGVRRTDEYTPTRDPRHGGGKAHLYGRMLVEEVLPFIESRYRIRTDWRGVGMGGSSLGGLVTLYLGLRYPMVFGRLAVLSPSIWWDRRVLIRLLAKARIPVRPRIWLDCGTRESHHLMRECRLLHEVLVRQGWRDDENLRFEIFEEATHTEAAWADRLDHVLRYLFPAPEQGEG